MSDVLSQNSSALLCDAHSSLVGPSIDQCAVTLTMLGFSSVSARLITVNPGFIFGWGLIFIFGAILCIVGTRVPVL